jgi:hypothetical protein
MNLVRAGLIYFVLMLMTIFTWFVLGRFMVSIFVILWTATSSVDAKDIIQNCILGTNLTFLFLLVVWTAWFAYAAHSHEAEQSYQTGRYP